MMLCPRCQGKLIHVNTTPGGMPILNCSGPCSRYWGIMELIKDEEVTKKQLPEPSREDLAKEEKTDVPEIDARTFDQIEKFLKG